MTNDNKSSTLKLDAFVRELYPQLMHGNDDTIRAITDLSNVLGSVLAVVLIQRPRIYPDVQRRVMAVIETMAVDVVTAARDQMKGQ